MTFHVCRTFRLYDDNGNKKLDAEEFRTGLRDYGIVLSDSELRELFTTLDTDGSGTVSFDEFLMALRVSDLRRRSCELAFVGDKYVGVCMVAVVNRSSPSYQDSGCRT